MATGLQRFARPSWMAVQDGGEQGDEMNAEIRTALGLPADANDAAVLDAISGLTAATDSAVGLGHNGIAAWRALVANNLRAEQRIHEIEQEEQRQWRESDAERAERLIALAGEAGRI